jgi:hypothetical protein
MKRKVHHKSKSGAICNIQNRWGSCFISSTSLARKGFLQEMFEDS